MPEIGDLRLDADGETILEWDGSRWLIGSLMSFGADVLEQLRGGLRRGIPFRHTGGPYGSIEGVPAQPAPLTLQARFPHLILHGRGITETIPLSAFEHPSVQRAAELGRAAAARMGAATRNPAVFVDPPLGSETPRRFPFNPDGLPIIHIEGDAVGLSGLQVDENGDLMAQVTLPQDSPLAREILDGRHPTVSIGVANTMLIHYDDDDWWTPERELLMLQALAKPAPERRSVWDRLMSDEDEPI